MYQQPRYFPGFPGQVLADQPAYQGVWQYDRFGRAYVGYVPVHLLTISHGPFLAPTVVEV